MTASVSSRLRVLIFTPHGSLGGGVGYFTRLLAERFSSRVGPELFIIGQRPGRMLRILRSLVPIYDAVRLIRVLLIRDHDVYHLNPSFGLQSLIRDGFFLTILSWVGRKKTVVLFHGWDGVLYQRIASKALYAFLFRSVYSRACRVLVLASEFGKDLQQLGLSRQAISCVTTMFDGRDYKGVVRERTDSEVRIVFLGRFVAAKGIYELLEAFRLAVAERPDMRLVMAGDGPELLPAKQMCIRLGLQEKVDFTGYVSGSSKAGILLNADVFALPSSHGEGCPIALLEAMAAKLPVIVTPVGGVPDIIRDGVNGILLDSVEPQSIASALSDLAEDRELRQRMGQQNAKIAWAEYESRSVARILETEYRRSVQN